LDGSQVLALLRLPDSPGLDRNSIRWLPGEIVDIPKGTNVPVIEYARLLRAGESIPAGLEAGFDQLGQLDRNWVWVLETDVEITGVLIGSPCHGACFIWRMSVDPKASQMSVVRLLRRFASDIRARGLKGYMLIIDPSTPTQTHLVRILEKIGAKRIKTVEWYAGSLPRPGL
jgi:hypothetical protein